MLAGTPAAILAFSASTLAVVAAACVVPRLVGRESRSERIAVAILAWNAIVVGPVYALGLFDHLYASTLAGVTSVVSFVVLAIAAGSFGLRGIPVEVSRTIGAIALAPVEALRITSRARSFAFVAALLAIFLWLYTTLQAVFLPTWGDWDCLWYHEPIIGFSIQNHGFAPVSLPPMEQKVNGYPRLSELTMLWFGIFHGRWAIDLVNPVVVPMLAASTYRAFRSGGADSARAIGWASVAVTLPGVVRMIPTTLVDAHGLALAMTALTFGLTPRIRIGDAVVSAFAMAMAIGVKLLFAVPLGVMALLVAGRLVSRRRELGSGRIAVVIAFGLALTVSVLSFTFVRNYRNFHNPVWPDFHVVEPRLGIDWPGNFTGTADPTLPGADRVPHGAVDQLRRLYGRPFTATDGHAWQIIDYGLGLPWVLIPAAMVLPAWAIARRASGGPSTRRRPRLVRYLVAMLVPSLVLIPAFHIGRYHLTSMLVFALVLEATGSRIGAGRFLDAIVGATVLGSVMTLAWNDHGFIRPPNELRDAVTDSWARRQHGPSYRSPDVYETALARERELRPGDVVAFDRMAYLALLWDDHYTTRAVWVGDAPNPVSRAHAIGARWFYSSNTGSARTILERPDQGFELVGTLETESFGRVFRSTRRRR